MEYDFDAPGTFYVRLSDGQRQVEIVAEATLNHRVLVLRGLHILGAGPNSMGPGAIRRLVRWAKEQLDVDTLRIEGATRTSGAGPGRLPTGFDA